MRADNKAVVKKKSIKFEGYCFSYLSVGLGTTFLKGNPVSKTLDEVLIGNVGNSNEWGYQVGWWELQDAAFLAKNLDISAFLAAVLTILSLCLSLWSHVEVHL